MRRLKGSIAKHGSGYRVYATVSQADGSQKRLTKVVHGSRADAERALQELYSEPMSDLTLSTLCDMYLRHVRESGLEPSTIRGYESNIECHIRKRLGYILVESMKPSHINRFVNSLDSNRLSVFKTLRQVLNWAYRMEYIESNPIQRVKPPKSNPPSVGKRDVYTSEECREILSKSMDDNLLIALCIAIGCGLRRGEICALQWSDYDGQRVSVTKAYGKETPKTMNGIRDVSVPGFAREILDSRRSTGSMVGMKPDSLTRKWERFLDSNPDIRRLPFKNLRHTSLTLAFEGSHDILAVSRRAGHGSVYITDRYYARPSQEIDDALGKVLDESISL